MCATEAIAWLAGEPHSDAPDCLSVVIGDFLRRWNDDLDDEQRQRLKPFLCPAIGSAAGREIEIMRSFVAGDWLIRTCVPAYLDAASYQDYAASLRGLPALREATFTCHAAALVRLRRLQPLRREETPGRSGYLGDASPELVCAAGVRAGAAAATAGVDWLEAVVEGYAFDIVTDVARGLPPDAVARVTRLVQGSALALLRALIAAPVG
jgi:hypothetical protein